jgi:hypothetical protein
MGETRESRTDACAGRVRQGDSNMKRIVGIVCGLCGLVAAGIGRAQTVTPPTYVLTTVDAVRRSGASTLFVTGVLDGASGPTEVRVYSDTANVPSVEACERFALTAMAKPGQYRLEVWQTSYYANGYCRLTKLNP